MFTQYIERDFGDAKLHPVTMGVPDEVLALRSVQKLLNLTPRSTRRSERRMGRAIRKVLDDLGVEHTSSDPRLNGSGSCRSIFIHPDQGQDRAHIALYQAQLPTLLKCGVGYEYRETNLDCAGSRIAYIDELHTVQLPYHWAIRASHGEHPLLPLESHEAGHLQIEVAGLRKLFDPWAVIIRPPLKTSRGGIYSTFVADENLMHLRDLKKLCSAMNIVQNSGEIPERAKLHFMETADHYLIDRFAQLRYFALITVGVAERILTSGEHFLSPTHLMGELAPHIGGFNLYTETPVSASTIIFRHSFREGVTSDYQVGLETATGIARLHRGVAHIYNQAFQLCVKTLESTDSTNEDARALFRKNQAMYREENDSWLEVTSESTDHSDWVYRLAQILTDRMKPALLAGIEALQENAPPHLNISTCP